MLVDYVPILVMFLVALFIAVFVIVLSGLLGPNRPSKRKTGVTIGDRNRSKYIRM